MIEAFSSFLKWPHNNFRTLEEIEKLKKIAVELAEAAAANQGGQHGNDHHNI